jgi:TIR domain
MRARPEAQLIDDLAEELKVDPLELDEAGRTMRREEIQIDVSGDPFRDIFSNGRPVLIPGIRVVVSIPFRGDHHLWQLQPSTYNLSPPRGTVKANRDGQSGVLELVIEQPADQPLENIKSRLDEITKNIDFFTTNQRNDLSGFGAQLRREVASAVADRRARLSKHDGLSDLLGIPEAHASVRLPSTPKPSPPSTSATSIPTADQAWDVFVSHASEDKESFARPLVRALEARGLKVWFDENTLKIGDSLRRSIDKGLARSRYGIVVVSKAFLSKEWPQRELDGLVAREEDGAKVVLPVWHEISAVEVRKYSPTLADRLAIPTSKGIDAVVTELLHVIGPAAEA